MTERNPFSGRSEKSQIGKWSLVGSGPEAERGRLERYCQEMNARDPYRRMWFVSKTDDDRHFVDCRERNAGEWGAPRQITGNPIIDRDQAA